jgi:glycosyltransferase involved in cell wall biosynthesis
MYHCPRALTTYNPRLYIDIYSRLEAGEPEVTELGERVRLIRRPCGNPEVYVPKEEFWFGPLQQFVDDVDNYVKQQGWRYDLIHGHYADGWYVAHHLGKRWGIPYCLTTHSLGKRKRANCLAMKEGTEEELEEKYCFCVRIEHETEALRQAARICSLTHEEGEYILKHYGGTRREQMFVTPNGILLSDFCPRDENKAAKLRKDLGIEEEDLVVFQCGRVDRRKGQKELLAAAPRVIREVKERSGRNVKFLLVGWTQGKFARTLEEKARKAGISNHVVFHPPVTNRNIPPFYWLADVYALTSTYDIFPIVILEAMANRLALVASRNGGASEIIAHNKDGLLIDPFKIEEVEDALIKVLVDESLRRELGEQAYRKVEENYTWERVAARVNRLYEEIVGEKGK